MLPAAGALTAGVAGRISGSLELNLPVPVGFTATNIELVINTTNQDVNSTFDMDGHTLTLDVDPGPYVRVAASGVKLTIAGVTLDVEARVRAVRRWRRVSAT